MFKIDRECLRIVPIYKVSHFVNITGIPFIEFFRTDILEYKIIVSFPMSGVQNFFLKRKQVHGISI